MRSQSADDERRQLWAHAVHCVYKKQIKHYVGKPLPELDGTRNIKIPTPEVYNGSSDVEVFDAWLLTVLRWMVISQYCGPDYDKFRVQLVGLYLSDKALEWYNDEVAGIHRTKKKWTFVETILGLFDCCVQATTIHQATQRFEEVEYDPEKGVRDFYSTLVRWASRMTQPPNTYAFKKRFLDGLPFDMVKRLIDKGAVPEYAKINTIVKAVERIEDNRVLQNYYVSSSRKKSKEISYFNKRSKYEKKTSSEPPPFKPKPVMVDGKPYKYVRFSKQPKHAGRVQSISAPQYKGKDLSREHNKSKRDSTGEKRKPIDKGSQLCYACGKVGHYANDPTCERYGQQRLYSIQEDDQMLASTSATHGEDDEVTEEVPDAATVSNTESESDENHDKDLFPSYESWSGESSNTSPYESCAAIESAGSDRPDHPKEVSTRQSSRSINRPDRGPIKDRRPLTASMDIGGLKAFVLLDLGCTIEALSPSFARVANIKVHQLNDQHTLQLGTVGSKAKFNYGATVNLRYEHITNSVYFDIVNIDRYDAIIGTRFMRKHGIQLDFDNDRIVIKGQAASTLTMGEDAAMFSRRMAMRRDERNDMIRRKEVSRNTE
ncbi:hypothetical protein FB446DRAFT_651431 [Lentinula raphanica]|nr:hypothetical protein FB446DRAFT_651431 [Lentinula raphanica]